MFLGRVDSNLNRRHVAFAQLFMHEYTTITSTLFIMCLFLFSIGHGSHGHCSEFPILNILSMIAV